jgi:hypothetical protein
MLSLAELALSSGGGTSMWADWVLTIFVLVIAIGFGIWGYTQTRR